MIQNKCKIYDGFDCSYIPQQKKTLLAWRRTKKSCDRVKMRLIF